MTWFIVTGFSLRGLPLLVLLVTWFTITGFGLPGLHLLITHTWCVIFVIFSLLSAVFLISFFLSILLLHLPFFKASSSVWLSRPSFTFSFPEFNLHRFFFLLLFFCVHPSYCYFSFCINFCARFHPSFRNSLLSLTSFIIPLTRLIIFQQAFFFHVYFSLPFHSVPFIQAVFSFFSVSPE